MANTQNLDLVKPLGTDHALVSVLNSNSDKIDAYAGAVNAGLDGLRDGLGILANGNTHAAITSGQYVYVKNHGSLPEGLYKATANIAANGTLSTSNLAADSAGGLNSLNEQIGTLNGKFSTIVMSHGLTAKTNVTLNGAALVACGLLRFYHFYFTPSADINAGTELIEGFTTPYLFLNGGALGIAIEATSRETCSIYLSNTGTLLCGSDLQNGKSYRCSLCYVSNTAV